LFFEKEVFFEGREEEVLSRPFDAACSVCTQAAKPLRKRD